MKVYEAVTICGALPMSLIPTAKLVVNPAAEKWRTLASISPNTAMRPREELPKGNVDDQIQQR